MSKLDEEYKSYINADKVRKMRDETGFGMAECRAMLIRDVRMKCVKEAETLDDLKEVLYDILLRNPRI